MTRARADRRQATKELPDGEYARRKLRQQALIEIGLGHERYVIAQSPRRFGARLIELGIDPEQYGDLHIPRRGGKPPIETTHARLRKTRYAYARQHCGMSSYEAGDIAVSQGKFARAMRLRRFKGHALAPLPPEIRWGIGSDKE